MATALGVGAVDAKFHWRAYKKYGHNLGLTKDAVER